MAQDFPNNPTLGQVFGSYVWNGTAWAGIGSANNLGVQVGGILAREAYDYHQNYVINGGFDIWQRGTSTTSNSAFLADRWGCYYDGSGTFTYSRQSFTPGSAPIAGYESEFFARYASTSSGTSTFAQLNTRLEDVRTLAGQTVTLSFFAKADSARTFTTYVEQYFGAGGSSTILANQTSHSVTTGWQRFTTTFTMPSISGKTITTGTYIQLTIRSTVSSSFNMDIWGVQLERGTVATTFRRNANSIQGELAACQRYFTTSYPIGFTPGSATYSGTVNGDGVYEVRTNSYLMAQALFHVPMRTAPTVTVYSPGTGAVNNVVRDRIGIQSADSSSISVNDVSNKSAQVYSSSGIEACRIVFHYTASAEL